MSPRLRYAVAAVLVLVLATGCSSDTDSGAGGQTAKPEATSGTAATGAGQDAAKIQAGPDIDTAEVARVAALDPDEAIERYRQECNAHDHSPRCRVLRRRVEYLFLDALTSLRAAGEELDQQFYRVAARAENPHLAILGLRGLILVKGPISAEDEQLIVAGLDNPYGGVRRTVLELATNLPAVSTMWPRVVAADPYASSVITFLDESHSSEPDPAVIRFYPGARYRYFASDATRHWFTTPDAPGKVIAFLTPDGKQALTADALKAKTEADVQQTYMKAAMSGDETKLTEAMQKMTAPTDIDLATSFQDLTGSGEIRYITLAPDHVIAVFTDDILHATSIVALLSPPAQKNPFVFDAEHPQDFEKALEELQKQAEREELAQKILGH